MSPAVIMPDMAAEFVAYMTPALAARTEPCTANVRTSSKRTTAKRQVLVRVNGGRALSDVRGTVSIGVTAIAETDALCSDLALLVAALVKAWPGIRPVVAAPFVGIPFPASDESEKPEHHFTAELTVRGRSL